MTKLDKRLADAGHNTKLLRTFPFYGDTVGMTCTIATEVIEKKRGAKPLSVLPTYCPFCAKKYLESVETTEVASAHEEAEVNG
ncbi:hypothetical protein [Stenotrophomonas sp.]|uniref:hypothetical protein n=1 Tax=Stenotrophomonas sp. TaxID=69392 RepID=UPI00289C12A5|nr:hypothetical protein [Stenotrophomonas sp.]